MGFKDVIGRLRSVFRRETAAIEQAVELSKGVSSPQGFDFSSLYGRYGMEPLLDYLRIEQELVARFLDYNEMESYPELSAALDIWADEATQPDVITGRTVWIESDDQQIKKLLQNLLDNTLQIDEDIWSMARNLSKYGNNYEEILTTNEGVVGLNPLPPETVRRFEREKGLLIGYAQDPSGRFGVSADDIDKALKGEASPPPGIGIFEPWQLAHFRLMARSRPSSYGISVLEPARWLWRRLLLLEDAALIYRLTRTPTRWIFYIDVGKLPPTQALGQIRKIKNEFTKQRFVNEKGGVDLRYNPLSSDENMFIPVVDGKRTTEVDLMATPEWQVMDDINYFRDKLFSAIRIPKAYLTEESETRSRVLSLLDIRFARGVMRVQRELKNGIKKICKVHLAAIGIDPEKVNFDVFLTVPSWAYELAQIEVRSAKAEFADKVSPYLSERALMKLIFGFSDEEIDALRKEKAQEAAEGVGGDDEKGGEKTERARPRTGGSVADLPGATRVLPREDEEKHFKILMERLDKMAGENKKVAQRLADIKDFSHDLRASMFFRGKGGKTRVVPSFGNGNGNERIA